MTPHPPYTPKLIREQEARSGKSPKDALKDSSTEDLERELEARRKTDTSALPYVGESVHRSNYTIKFGPVYGVFNDDDAVRDAIHHSAWNEDSEFHDASFERGESAVPPETHPWICECGECVSTTDKGRCSYCGEVKWSKR
jgi:hypothetical protein